MTIKHKQTPRYKLYIKFKDWSSQDIIEEFNCRADINEYITIVDNTVDQCYIKDHITNKIEWIKK